MQVKPFDLVVVNLYPFGDTVSSGADFDECMEQIDIGGPALIRAAAKNFEQIRASFKGAYKDLQEEQSSRVRGGIGMAYDQ